MPGILVDDERRTAWLLDGAGFTFFRIQFASYSKACDVALPGVPLTRALGPGPRVHFKERRWWCSAFLRSVEGDVDWEEVFDEPRPLEDGDSVVHERKLTFGHNGSPPCDRNERRRGRASTAEFAALQSSLNRAHALRERDPMNAASEFLKLARQSLQFGSGEAIFATRSLLRITRDDAIVDATRESAEAVVHDASDEATRWLGIEVLGVLNAGGSRGAARALSGLTHSTTVWMRGLALAVMNPQKGHGQPHWVDSGPAPS